MSDLFTVTRASVPRPSAYEGYEWADAVAAFFLAVSNRTPATLEFTPEEGT